MLNQMRLLISLLLVFYVCYLGAETVYKTVDEEGNTIFTDKPSESATEIKIDELQTIDNPNPAKYKASSKQSDKKKFKYNSLTVTNPESGAGIRSNNGNVTISVSLEPSLRGGDKILITMDGKQVGTGSSVSIQNVDRGTHSINASVVDGNGKTLISTSSSFSLLRASQ
jgi:uncharacterized protein DUF4124